jgi:hypothetical protein
MISHVGGRGAEIKVFVTSILLSMKEIKRSI